MPLFAFVILFGLSMDYTILVLERIREARRAGLLRRARRRREGVGATAGTVTSAAIVMVAVFAIFATLRLLEMKELGVGLAVAVLLDATIVRGVALPAAVDAARRARLARAAPGAPRAAGMMRAAPVAASRQRCTLRSHTTDRRPATGASARRPLGPCWLQLRCRRCSGSSPRSIWALGGPGYYWPVWVWFGLGGRGRAPRRRSAGR